MSIVNFANHYKILHQQKFSFQQFSLVPIRFEDRYKIMKWRNEQIYHLRQNKPITVQEQDSYFINVVSKLFERIDNKVWLHPQLCILYTQWISLKHSLTVSKYLSKYLNIYS
jgi:hypothetical protein